MRRILRSILVAATVNVLSISYASALSPVRGPRIEVAFVLDSTGSMAGLIDGAKRKIWSIANAIVDENPNADIRMALIAYRDRGDDYVTRIYDMTSDVQDIYGNLTRVEAAGGGDGPESVNEALDKAVAGLSWSSVPQTRKIVFLVGDAPPHMDYGDEKLYPQIVRDAVRNNIIVNAVQAGGAGETRQVWQDIARRGQGRYIEIPQDGGAVVVIESPYDDEILELQGELDRTILPYGNRGQREMVTKKVELRDAAPKSVQVDNSSFYAKRSGAAAEVVTGNGDLLGDIANNRVTLDKVEEAQLPDVLRGKNASERQAYVDDLGAKRRGLQNRVADLVRKRDAYVADKRKSAPAGRADSFDRAVESTLKEQLK